MNEKKSLAEEALLQMKQVEDVIAENAKGILASTMKEEINQLVKESLSEQEDDEDEDETGMGAMPEPGEDESGEDYDDSDEDESEDESGDDLPMGSAMDQTMDSDDETIDLTNATDEEILKVFKAMGEEDGIIIKKDGQDIHLTDNDADTEYLIKLGESELDMETLDEIEDADTERVIDAIFSDQPVDADEFESEMTPMDEDEVVYEVELEEDMDEDEDMTGMGKVEEDMDEFNEGMEEYNESMVGMDGIEEDMDEDEDMMGSNETIYEIELEEDMDEFNEGMVGMDGVEEDMDEFAEEMGEFDEQYAEDDIDQSFGGSEYDDTVYESYSHKKSSKSIKPKGRVGHGPKFSYKKTTGGFNEKRKEGPKTMGTGKPKFTYKKGENMEGKMKTVKKVEAKEASRTYGMGSSAGRGLRKGITPNRNLKFEALEAEINMLREKNEEYRQALNVFREKLNEVAIFNSNLAYATRLFTEHSTTKKEKINILRRFDGVETLKESKSLYKSIKDELGQVESKSINESVETKLNKTVSTGSSTSLIESKTYENPQFMRIKDLMSKMG